MARAMRPKAARRALAPQLRAYARLGDGMRWLPYLMFSQTAGFRSEVVNTDCHGFRWSILPDGSVASVEDPPGESCGVVVGGSTAFGVGATSDAGSVASRLAACTGRPFLNLAARGHCSTQELLAFMLYSDALPRVSHIVVMSGVNDLYMQYAANHFDVQLGAFFYSDLYFDAMAQAGRSVPERLRGALRRRGRRRPRRAFETLLDEREGRRDRVIAVMRRNLSQLAALAASRSARLVYALQPTFPWLRKQPRAEEQALFDAREAQDPRRELMIDRVLSPANGERCAAELRKTCDELGIAFVELADQ